MAAKPVSTMSPARVQRVAKPAKMTTPLHGAQNHSYGESSAKSVVNKLINGGKASGC